MAAPNQPARQGAGFRGCVLPKERFVKKVASTRAVALALLASAAATLAGSHGAAAQPSAAGFPIGRHSVTTLPMPRGMFVRSGTYTPSGKVLVRYASDKAVEGRQVNLATIDDDGRNFRPFFSGVLPERPKDNGIRFMVFPDNKRIFLGDFVLECATGLETCRNPALLPVRYPAEVDAGPHVMHRWSEMIVAPDNKSIAWTTLFNNGTADVFTAELRKEGAGYVTANPLIVSTLVPFPRDPNHADGVLPQPIRGGEVKQFVHGGTAISVAGGTERDIADSVVHHLASGRMEVITRTPGYDETTIFSPDERLGVVMSARFSAKSDPAILALMPRPYPDSLNMGLNWAAYTYAVTGVRKARPGNVGPALIEIDQGEDRARLPRRQPQHRHGLDLQLANVLASGRQEGALAGIPARRHHRFAATPDPAPARLPARPDRAGAADAERDGLRGQRFVRAQGLRRQADEHRRQGLWPRLGAHRLSPDARGHREDVRQLQRRRAEHLVGNETMQANPRGNSIYTANVRLTGPKPGLMNLRMTFGPLSGELPAQLIFAPDASGVPLTNGYVEYDGKRLNVQDLTP